MQVVVGSGKGGTGKTLLSTALAQCWGDRVQYLDCDVEEPNGHIFLRPELSSRKECTVTVPEIVRDKCSLCGKCRDICQFNSIAIFGETIMTFGDMCHSCNGCFLVCEEEAILETTRLIGEVETGHSGDVEFVHGRLRVGEAMSVPLIKAVKQHAGGDGLTIVDAPPGTSCPFVESVTDGDYILLVTESTPFGLHDLQLAVEVVRSVDKPFGVVINRAGLGDVSVKKWCENEGIPVVLQIPFERSIAEGYAQGMSLLESKPSLRSRLRELLEEISR
ncbi:MAG: ATP-binding protein [Thermodesulfobacteriota bacterium]